MTTGDPRAHHRSHISHEPGSLMHPDWPEPWGHSSQAIVPEHSMTCWAKYGSSGRFIAGLQQKIWSRITLDCASTTGSLCVNDIILAEMLDCKDWGPSLSHIHGNAQHRVESILPTHLRHLVYSGAKKSSQIWMRNRLNFRYTTPGACCLWPTKS